MSGDFRGEKGKGAEVSLGNAIGRMTSLLAIPYGYTVTLWSAGALSVTRLGPPSALDVLLFAFGGVVAFVALAAWGHPHLDAEVPMHVPALVVFNLFPIVVALAVMALPTGLLGRSLGYLLNSFLATAAYILCLAILIRVSAALERRKLRLGVVRKD